jgi:hypothetical protein
MEIRRGTARRARARTQSHPHPFSIVGARSDRPRPIPRPRDPLRSSCGRSMPDHDRDGDGAVGMLRPYQRGARRWTPRTTVTAEPGGARNAVPQRTSAPIPANPVGAGFKPAPAHSRGRAALPVCRRGEACPTTTEMAVAPWACFARNKDASGAPVADRARSECVGARHAVPLRAAAAARACTPGRDVGDYGL